MDELWGDGGALPEPKGKWRAVYERLDKLSRKRALTEPESRMLERAIMHEVADVEEGDTRPAIASAGRWTEDDDARFFDAIADGQTVAFAARLVGKSKNAGVSRLTRVRQSFGRQGQ